jgi:hypothetical protein
MVEATHEGSLVDLTAYRLERMLHEYSHDELMHQALLDIIGDYYLGLIAIGWEDGNPVVLPMESSTTWNHGIPPGFSIMGSVSPAQPPEDTDKDSP